MNKKSLLVITIVIAFILTGCSVSKPTQVGLTEAEAKGIAEENCIKGGESLSPGYYNENSKTWWFDANLNSTKEGCNPACVVSEDTKTAEINWRCTGLKAPTTPKAMDTNPAAQDEATTVTDTQANNEKTFTLADISSHNSENDCWMVIDGKVYNVTAYVAMHNPAIIDGCGIDATSLFGSVGKHSQPQIQALLGQYLIGVLK